MNADLLDLATKSYQRRQSRFSMKRCDAQLLMLLAYRALQKFDALTNLQRIW